MSTDTPYVQGPEKYGQGPEKKVWCDRSLTEVTEAFAVDPAEGLSDAVVRERQSHYGPNRLTEPARRSKLSLFLGQFRSGIVYVLAGAGVLAGAFGDYKDLTVIFIVLFINGLLGYFQESKASNALAALERMLVTRVRVRRDGQTVEIDIDEVVPGDIVLLEAGDRVPADARVVFAANASIDESSLTGESVAVDKDATVVSSADSPLGDHQGMVYMNTTVVRGRAEVVVVAIGMATEIGHVAEMITAVETEATPLEKQLDELGRRLAVIAGFAAVVVFGSQWWIEKSFQLAVLSAVALAVAAIPEGLPAVVTVTLAVGLSKMAKDNAIVKRLPSVETLGSTSVICSDKTGTLTLNQMTAREVVRGGQVWLVDGKGYEPVGGISAAGGRIVHDAADALLPAALCSDAVLIVTEEGHPGIIGDPTEAALVVLAAKAGLDAPVERAKRPRLAEVPFDSATKFMATFHRVDPDKTDSDVLVCLKGAPDVVIAKCASYADSEGGTAELDANAQIARHADNDALASQGLRVLALATRVVPFGQMFNADGTINDPNAFLSELRLEMLVGIVDPPRMEVRDAIAQCHRAGISVKMITGDHAVTAGAIANQLGIEGEVVTGVQLSAMSDSELDERISSIAVCARVSPDHKVRVVEALRRTNQIVAMTGDGVNDAAALRRADIGVAMGITGTEVTKEAADMVLTDDNFSSIISAVRRGRAVYDNILKFISFQVATAFGAIGTILGASILGQPSPFTPLQVLWVNLIADGPTAVSLGIDESDPSLMSRKPVKHGAAILDRRRIGTAVFQGGISAAGVLLLYVLAINHYYPNLANSEHPTVAMTMAFTAFVLCQVVNVFNVRSQTRSVFSRHTFTNKALWLSVGFVVVAQLLITEVSIFMSLFDTQKLSFEQWLICFLPALVLLVAVEVWKAVLRVVAGPQELRRESKQIDMSNV